jgi:hypothetical protein
MATERYTLVVGEENDVGTQEFSIHVPNVITASVNETELIESIFETILDDVEDKNISTVDMTIEFCFGNTRRTLQLDHLNLLSCSCFDILFAMHEQGITFTLPADLHVRITKNV